MNRSLLMIALLGSMTMVAACDQKPTVVNVPPVLVPGPAGPTGATGATGNQGSSGMTGATGEPGTAGSGTTVIVTPAASSASN